MSECILCAALQSFSSEENIKNIQKNNQSYKQHYRNEFYVHIARFQQLLTKTYKVWVWDKATNIIWYATFSPAQNFTFRKNGLQISKKYFYFKVH